jgi:aquaporin Z
MAFLVMLTVLHLSNSATLNRYTGLVVGALVATYITIEAPFSGMSINPARTLASGLPSGQLQALWVYFSAPLSGMVLAAFAYRTLWSAHTPACAKLNHHTHRRCIFNCRFGDLPQCASSREQTPSPDPRGELPL